LAQRAHEQLKQQRAAKAAMRSAFLRELEEKGPEAARKLAAEQKKVSAASRWV
jgi:hypothetical protein